MSKPTINMLPAGFSDSDESDDDYGFSSYDKPKRRPNAYNKAPVVRRIDYQEEFRKETSLNNLDGVKAAFGQGVIVDQVTSEGFNALMTACHMGHADIVAFLLEVGANPNFQNRELFTPLMVLCFSHCQNEEHLLCCAKILINNEVNINAADTHGTTSLMYASKCGHGLVVKELLSHGVNLNVQDNQGWTALFWAVNRTNLEIVQFLVEAGARKKVKDLRGRIAYDLVSGRKGKEEIANILCPKKLRFELAEETEDLVDYTCQLNDNVDTEIGNLLASIKKYDNISLPTDHKLDGSVLNLYSFLTITDAELTSCGIKYPWHRRHTLEFIKELHLRPWAREELLKKGRFGKTVKSEEPKSLTYINAAHLIVAMEERLVFIQASASYLRKQWCSAVLSATSTEAESDNITTETLLQDIASAKSALEICHYMAQSILRNIADISAAVDKANRTEVLPSDLLMGKEEEKNASVVKSVLGWSSFFVMGLIVWKVANLLRR